MEFGVLHGIMSLENSHQNNLVSWGDLDHNTKWVGSEGWFYNQPSSVATGLYEDNIYKKMVLQHHRSIGSQNMLSFSSPNSPNYGAAGHFTPSQWMELQHQALIFKYITANTAIPSNLLNPIKQNTLGWGPLHLGLCKGSDPEPGRCRRTDGKKWRCAKDAVTDQKYCERHINRGRHRSRKPVEPQNCHSLRTNTTGNGSKLTTGVPMLAVTCQDNSHRKTNMEFMTLSSSSIPLKKTPLSIWGEPSSKTEFELPSLLKSDTRSQNLLQLIHSSETSVSKTNEKLDYSPYRIGYGMHEQTNQVAGGPLGEVLQLSTNKI